MRISIVLLNYDVLMTCAYVLISRQTNIWLGRIGALGSCLLMFLSRGALGLVRHGMSLVVLKVIQLDLPDI